MIDIPINFRVISEKLNKERQSTNKEIIDKNISKYIPGLAERAYQRIINFIKAKRQLVDPSSAEIQNIEFHIKLSANQYANPRVFIFVFLWKEKKQK